jgi:hypothetical protein
VSGAAADARLAQLWDAVFQAGPDGQQIIHVLTWPAADPAWLAGFAPFQAWQRSGEVAGEATWQSFAQAAAGWPYIRDARRAAALAIPNTRIFVHTRAQWREPPPWLRFLAQVHLPAIAAMAGETLYRVWREDCAGSGLPPREHDANIWGAGGVMLAGYGDDGDVAWREFLADDDDPARSGPERAFVLAMRDYAAAQGERVTLPSGPLLLKY